MACTSLLFSLLTGFGFVAESDAMYGRLSAPFCAHDHSPYAQMLGEPPRSDDADRVGTGPGSSGLRCTPNRDPDPLDPPAGAEARDSDSELLLASTYLWGTQKHSSIIKQTRQSCSGTITQYMSNPNTNSGEREPVSDPFALLVKLTMFAVASSPISDQTKQGEKEQLKRWWTGAAAAALGYAVRGPPPTPQSTTRPSPSPRAQSRQHDPNAKARSKRYQEWSAYGDLEPSGCPPWFL